MARDPRLWPVNKSRANRRFIPLNPRDGAEWRSRTEFLGTEEIKKAVDEPPEEVPHSYLVSIVAKELWGVKRFFCAGSLHDGGCPNLDKASQNRAMRGTRQPGAL